MQRYAIYFAPLPDTPLWRFGSAVVGYDAATGMDADFPAELRGTWPDWPDITSEPRRYGFHATLKAPFELAANATTAMLFDSADALAETQEPVSLACLRIAEIGCFISLVPATPSTALQALAGTAVTTLDHLRAPMSDADRVRRLQSPLSERQRGHLERYGYPHVLDDFRFHMTLTGPINDPARRSDIAAALTDLHARRVPEGDVCLDALTIYGQPARDQRFRIIRRVPLAGRPPPSAPR
ncbi:MAG: DUF1045 domain-containing protein [Hyphomicrobiaceae bacterium]